MPLPRPTVEDILALAQQDGFTLTTSEAEAYRQELESPLAAYDMLERLYIKPSPRSIDWRPGDDPYRGWAARCELSEGAEGPLTGRTVALKDNIMLAGVPMMNGSATLADFIPSEDASVVTRLLAAGATVAGKATCENFCMSGGSHTSDPLPVLNPRKPDHSAGGSSSGCAALVASGEVDMAIGGDQGGSIRIPSAFCGIYGMKPTHGLVPYTGIMPIESTLDHAGPMTRSVADNAALLEVIAGHDGLDPRQYDVPAQPSYRASDRRKLNTLRVGLLSEGFEVANMMPAVAEAVRGAMHEIAPQLASLDDVSVPEHHLAPSIWTPLATEGMTCQMLDGYGMGFNWKGRYSPELLEAHSDWREKADTLPATLKLSLLAGRWGLAQGRGGWYAKAQNLALMLRAAYDAALETCDLLVMPTVPCNAHSLPGPDATLAEIIYKASMMNVSTCPFDVSGHPAMSVPCGTVDGLPVGLMIVGRHFDENTIYGLASGLEALGRFKV